MDKTNINRRAMLKSGAAIIGAGVLGTAATIPHQQSGPYVNNVFNVKDFGATGKKEDKATVALKNAIDTCTNAGGGVVFVPPGDYTVGTVQLKDNVTLHLEAGSTLFLSQDQEDFIPGSRTMIFAEKAKNIAVTGRGTLDGLAKYVFTEMRELDVEIVEEIEIAKAAGVDMRRYYRTGMQTYMFILNDCTNILLQDFTLINSPLWNIRLNDCDRVFVRGVYIYSDLEKGVNADGIDICSTSNVTISDSIIVTGDDSIVLKTPSRRGSDKVNPIYNVVVTNCILGSSSAPFTIGTETFADVSHVIVSNCTIRNSNKGFGINVQDGATVSNVIFNNITVETVRSHWNWWGSAELCKFILRRRNENSKLGRIKDVVVDNIISHPRGTSILKGHPEQPLENFRFSNVQMFMTPEDAKDKRATDAIIIDHVDGLKISDMTIKWAEEGAEPKWKSALVMKNVNDFDIRYFSGRQGLKDNDIPAIILENITEGQITESRALAGCSTFIQMKEKEKANLYLRNNNTTKAKKEISYIK
jgi:Endopolygalacturonase